LREHWGESVHGLDRSVEQMWLASGRNGPLTMLPIQSKMKKKEGKEEKRKNRHTEGASKGNTASVRLNLK
jgi:hypothetical protein